MDESIFHRVAKATRSKRAWDVLEMASQGTMKVKVVKLQILKTSFESLNMKDSKSIDEFLCQAMNVINQITWR